MPGMCGKRIFLKKREARWAANRLMERRERRNKPRRLRVYFCRKCGGWHLTKQDKIS